jgi:hypothetical protein
MSARVVILGVVIGGAANELDIMFELAPGSDDVTTTDIQWAIICGGNKDDDTFADAATHQIGTAGLDATIEAGQTYATTITATNCNPAANDDHTLLIVAGRGGQTYEVLNYGGDVSAGEVVI